MQRLLLSGQSEEPKGGNKMYYAVIDTNVLVSALFSEDFLKSAPGMVINHVFIGKIIPIYNEDILEEYREVLCRAKFHFPLSRVKMLVEEIEKRGIHESRLVSEEVFTDADDAVFFEVTLSHRRKRETYLVTGNTKHFPIQPFVVTPRQMIEIMESNHRDSNV